MAAERLQKVLAASGQGSRRVSEQLIADGRVTVNGKLATLGDRADPTSDVIAVDGERIHTNTDLVYLLLNKPLGCVTTANDPEGRPTVLDLVPPTPRVFPIGRLDQDTSGLLLLTNDGELANRVAHPRYQVPKTYMVQVRGPVSRHALKKFTQGVELEDGIARARSAKLKVADQTRSLLELVLTEGKKREVRRMVDAVGLELEALVRTRVGPIHLGDIKPSKVRPLNGKEVRELYAAVGMDGRLDADTADTPAPDPRPPDRGVGVAGTSPPPPAARRVAILGTGLIGASLGMALRASDLVSEVIGYDSDRAGLETALARGAIDHIAVDPVDAVATADVVVLAVPPSSIPDLARAIAPHLAPGTILTDVGSVKRDVVAAMEAAAGPGVHVVGGHPMAGSHEHGAAHAVSNLFVGATWLLTPTPRTDTSAIAVMSDLIAAIGARVVVVDTEAHDMLVAVVSHLPQLTATTLMTLAAERARRQDARLLLLAGGGFRDATRVAASNPAMWLDICRENREAIVAVLDEYAARIGQLRMMLFEGDEERLVRLLTDAREARQSLPGKESASGQLVELRVTIPDQPGAIAAITACVSELGVNIEDLAIEHAPDGHRGTMRMAVNGFEAATATRDALVARGYEILERAS